jgi:hypothetical protein
MIAGRPPINEVVHECSTKTEKENYMSNNQDNRVLGRIGARELSPEELEQVSGGLPVHTNVITFNPVTRQRDGDGI